MRLQKQLSRRVGNTEYAKFVIVIPPQAVKQLGWNDGEELDGEIKDREFILRRKKD